MNRATRVLAIVGAVLGFLILLLLILPLMFRGRIEERVKTALNQKLTARVDWRGLGLTFFRNFPNLTLTLDDLTAVGTRRFQGDTLAAIPHLRVVVNIGSALGAVLSGKTLEIRAFELDQPRLSLLALEDGTANWDITRKAAAPSQAGKPMTVKLKHLEIRDAAVAFENRKNRLQATLRGYTQSLSGDFSARLTKLQTKASADSVSLSFAGMPYLNRVKLALTADAEADLEKKSYTLKETQLRLNDLVLGVAGSAQSAGKNLALDLTFNAPSTKFRDILSLVPVVYAHDFDKVKTAGTMAVKGRIKGEYGDSAFPSLALNAAVDSAAFQYPDLPLPARDITLRLALTNPGGSLDSTVANLERFHLRIGSNPVDARLVLRTPVSDPDVDARVTGKIDLADLSKTIKMEGVDQMTGSVAADAAVRTRLSALERKQYDRVSASGTVDLGNISLKGKDLPRPVTIRQASLRLASEAAELKSFEGTIGNSDVQASGRLQNLLAFVMKRDTLVGTAMVQSRRFDLNEWQSKESGLQVIPVPARVDFDLNTNIGELTYGKLKMNNARGRLRIKDQRMTLLDFRMNTLGGEIGLSGFYETVDTTKPTFDVGFTMNKVDIPSAFQAFTTVQMLAPVARYAAGEVSTDLRLAGALGKDMVPLFPGLDGRGSLQTSRLVIKDFPALEKIVSATKLQFFNNPTLEALRAAFQIRDGRLFVQPCDVKLGPTTVNVSGSNGLDQSLQYDLKLQVPRALLGGGANEALAGLLAKAGKAGIDLQAAPDIPLGIRLAGKVTDPNVSVDVGSLASGTAEGAKEAVTQAITEKVDTAASRLLQEAEQRAAAIRQQAESLAATVKREAYTRADSLEGRASTPLAKAAAKPLADQIRKEADSKAADIVGQASRQADSLVASVRKRGD